MSVWTHVAAIVRIDALRFEEADNETWVNRIRDHFGKECLWGSGSDVWEDWNAHPDKFLPGGSEGTLQLYICVNPNLSHCAAFVVTIFGDLRDVGDDEKDLDEIINWFENKVSDGCSLSVRQACITVTNGRKEISRSFGA